uniref:Retinol dehydrogenase 12 n=1 Tax=Steinernema glaseri TaxID=37863 RepID=A0A1I8AW87_9BILA
MADKTEQKRQFSSRTTALEVVKNVDLSDKTILITGCTSGIGVETLRAFVLSGASVIMANRNTEASEQLRDNLYKETEHRKIHIIQCDLSSLASVRNAAHAFLAMNCPLHVLVLNAGVFAPDGFSVCRTVDGFETAFGVNHLGHFYLTSLLLPKLRESTYSRIVVVSSLSHNHTGIEPTLSTEEKLNTLIPQGEVSDGCYKLYGKSKLCNVLFANRIARVEKEHGIHAYSLHPGTMIATNIQRSFGIVGKFYTMVTKFFTRSVAQGAATTVYCAAHSDVSEDSERYYDCCWYQDKSYDAKLADDEELQEALWRESARLIKKFEEEQEKGDAA